MKKLGKRIIAAALVVMVGIFASGTASAENISSAHTGSIRSLSDMNNSNKRLAVVAGDESEFFFEELFPAAERIYANSYTDRILMLDSKKVDGFMAYDTELSEILEPYPSFVALSEPVKTCSCAFFASNDNNGKALCKEFDDFYKSAEADGEIAPIFDKWVNGNNAEKVMSHTEFTGENGLLNVVFAFYEYPFNYVRDGETVGYNIEIVNRFCEKNGYTPVFHNVDSTTSAIAGIKSGKYDLCASRTVYSEERAESVQLTAPIADVITYMIVRRADVAPDVLAEIDAANGTLPEGFRQSSDLNKAGIKIACVAGSPDEQMTRSIFPDAECVYANSNIDRAMMIDIEKADGSIFYESSAKDVLSQYRSLVAFPEPVKVSECAFFVNKSERGEAIQAQFNEYLRGLRDSGEYGAMYDKWLGDSGADATMPEFAFTGESGTISFASDPTIYPYTFLKDGEYCGFYIELGNRFCEEYGYAPEYHKVASTAAIAGITSGKYDVYLMDTPISDERAEVVLFTDIIANYNEYMLVRRDAVAPDVLAEIDAANGTISAAATDDENPFTAFFNGLGSSFEKNFIRENRWQMLLSGLLITIEMAALAAVFGTGLGALICYLRTRKNRLARGFAAVYVKIFQGTPIVVLLLVLYYVIFGSTDITAFTVCVLGFSLDFSAYVSEMIRSGIEAVPSGQKRAALALGYGQAHAFREIVLPQAVRHILPVYRGQLVAMVKMTSIAGYISVEDLTKVSDIIRSRTYEAFFPLICTAVIYFLLANALTSLLKVIQLKTDPNNRKRLPKGAQ